MNGEEIAPNGFNGYTGHPILPTLSTLAIGRIALGLTPDDELAEIVETYLAGIQAKDPFRDARLKFDDPTCLAETGWGVVFARGVPAAVRRALQPLLEVRERQAGVRYFELSPALATTPPRILDPDRYPYYVLLVGSPREFSFEQQSRHDVQYAVGRLFFEGEKDRAGCIASEWVRDAEDHKPEGTSGEMDAPEFHDVEAYGAYAQAVVDAEDRFSRRDLVLFGVRTPGDPATERMAANLMVPLASALAASSSRGRWNIRPFIGEGAAHRDRLRDLLGGSETPGLLLTASHGIAFPCGDPRQLDEQGALLCQDWPGSTPVGRGHYFTAADLEPSPRLRGLIVFQLACFGVGTPEYDSFALDALGEGRRIAPRPFLSRLPQKLLAAGARAVIGHIDRAWTSTFNWVDPTRPSAAYIAMFEHLMQGMPVGYALEFLDRYGASLSRELNQLWNLHRKGVAVDAGYFGGLWCAVEDAAGFQVLGDPAVRLNID